jgi:hypothetical protein
MIADCLALYSIKKPTTHRYPSLKGTDPKFRRNHRHALHGTMRALVRSSTTPTGNIILIPVIEGGEGGQARLGIRNDR